MTKNVSVMLCLLCNTDSLDYTMYNHMLKSNILNPHTCTTTPCLHHIHLLVQINTHFTISLILYNLIKYELATIDYSYGYCIVDTGILHQL